MSSINSKNILKNLTSISESKKDKQAISIPRELKNTFIDKFGKDGVDKAVLDLYNEFKKNL